MLDELLPPSVAPTIAPPAVQQPPMVNTGPAYQQQQQAFDNTAYWENRLRGIQSLADQRLTENNRLATQIADLQRQVIDAQNSGATTLTQANETNTSQQARIATLELENKAIKAQLARANIFRTRPHLAEFDQFLPQTDDQGALEQAAGLLDERITALRGAQQQVQSAVQPQAPATPMLPTSLPPTLPGQPANMPSLPPPVQPAQLNAGTGESAKAAIDRLFKNATTPQEFQAARQQAIQLANQESERLRQGLR